MVLQITYRIYRCDDNQYELLFKLDLKFKKKRLCCLIKNL